MFHPKLLINFLSLSITGHIDWHVLRKFVGSTGPALKPGRSLDHSGLLRVHQARLTCFRTDMRFWHARWDPTIVMATHNNSDILMVPYEDLPDEDKDIISKAIEKFQNKCLLSYTKTCDNKVIQKYPRPRVLMHG